MLAYFEAHTYRRFGFARARSRMPQRSPAVTAEVCGMGPYHLRDPVSP